MYAVIRAGGHQYRVEKGSTIRLDRQKLNVGDAFETNEVLLLHDGDSPRVGAPFVPGARVVGTVVSNEKGKKIRVFKYKSKKNYRRRYGHRSHYTMVMVNEIEF